MAHAYTIYPAKPAFGNFTKHLSYSEVLANKRANHIYYDCNRTNTIDCQGDNCKPTNRIWSQGDLLAIRKITSQACADGCEVLPFNKSNLQVNLITELDLNNIIVLELNSNPGTPSKIDPDLRPNTICWFATFSFTINRIGSIAIIINVICSFVCQNL